MEKNLQGTGGDGRENQQRPSGFVIWRHKGAAWHRSNHCFSIVFSSL